jgi:hypothetical protein
MVRSEASTVEEYLADLPAERWEAISTVRDTILDNLPDGFEETMNWGMIAYQVPLSVYPDTYNKRPQMYAALASQKKDMAVYLTGVYMDNAYRDTFEAAYRATGKRLDVGRSCVRFRKLDDLPLELIGETIGRLDLDTFVERVKQVQSPRKANKSG